jgi:hypothetical protein
MRSWTRSSVTCLMKDVKIQRAIFLADGKVGKKEAWARILDSGPEIWSNSWGRGIESRGGWKVIKLLVLIVEVHRVHYRVLMVSLIFFVVLYIWISLLKDGNTGSRFEIFQVFADCLASSQESNKLTQTFINVPHAGVFSESSDGNSPQCGDNSTRFPLKFTLFE